MDNTPKFRIRDIAVLQAMVVDRTIKVDAAQWDSAAMTHVTAQAMGRTVRLAASDDLVVAFLAAGGVIGPFVNAG
jgi:hypothetical protein